MPHGSPKVDGATGAQYVALTNTTGDQIGTLSNPIRNTPVGITQVQITDGAGNPVTITGNALEVTGISGGGGGGGAVTVANGADVALGNTADAAVTTDTTGTISAKLRGLVALIASVRATDKLRVNVENASLAVTAADGSDVAIGATTDAAVSTDTTGSISAKLRGLVKILADVWDDANNRLRVNVENTLLAVKQVGSAFSTGQVSIATTATQILAANANRARLVIVQHGTTDVYLGGSGVTTSNGALLKGVAGNQFAVRSTAAVYGIVGSGAQSVSYIEETN